MKKNWLTTALLATLVVMPMTAGIVRGTVVDGDTKQPISGVTVSMSGGEFVTTTAADGSYQLQGVDEGNGVIAFHATDYALQSIDVTVMSEPTSVNVELDPVQDVKTEVQSDVQASREENTLLFDEAMLEDEGATSSQSVAYLSGSSDDPFLSASSYVFSPMRFSIRGYDQRDHATYINGIDFTDTERGRFNYSSIGGLNNATRNKDNVHGLEMTGFGYGSLTGATNINTLAADYAAGAQVGLSYTNRAYNLRAQATYATGLMNNGWAFTGSLVYRWADKGRAEGTSYDSFGYFFAAQKVWNNHSIALTTWGAPTQRGQSSASIQEVYNYRGIYYNSYWGYQDGKVRNSRVVESYDPTVLLNYIWDINNESKLQVGAAWHYNKYSNSALSFYNAPDPRPDYYRNLPSFQYTNLGVNGPADTEDPNYGYVNQELYTQLQDKWLSNDPTVTQINWDALYRANYLNNVASPQASAHYMLERRHNDLMETALNALYTNQVTDQLKINAGVSAKYGKGMHYKTVEDLLGGNQWIDIDQFAERDFANNSVIIQNDVDNPNRVVREGDVFGYNYNLHVLKSQAFIDNFWNTRHLDIYYALALNYTQFQREGLMRNGRAEVINALSKGYGHRIWTLDPSFKAGLTWKADAHNRVIVNALAESRAPLPSYSYVAPRVKDNLIPGLQSEKVLSYDLNWIFNYSRVKGRVTLFQTHMVDGTESTGYYNDEFRTYVNHTMTGVDRVFRGVELGVDIDLVAGFSLELAANLGDYRYTDDCIGVMSAENGCNLFTGELPTDLSETTDVVEKVYTKGLMVSNGPQVAASVTLDYFHSSMWFADVTLSYYDKNYLDFSPARFTKMNVDGGYYLNEIGQYQYYAGYDEETKAILGTQERLKGGFLLDASVGKVLYFNNRKQSLNINLSLNNLLNNTSMVTGGYQQSRLSRNNKSAVKAIEAVDKFPNRYYYAWGFNMFLNVAFKF